MLELPTEKNDETLEKVLYFEDDVEEEKKDNKNLLKKVEDSLKLSESQEEAKLRYEILRDRLKEMVEKSPKESAQLFTDLVKDKE
jgi:flagellar M-ring protein FliF